MAGDALPLVTVQYPGVGEASDMVVGFPLVGALGVVGAGNDGSIPEEIHFDVLNSDQGRFEQRISNVRQEMLLVTDLSVPLGVDEPAIDKGIERGDVAVDLRFIPHVLKHK